MKKHSFILITINLILLTGLMGQNDVGYTNFMFNKLAYNAGYAGSKGTLTLGTLYRSQWAGIDGAPKTITAFGHMPFAKQRNGLGLSITSDKIGMFRINAADFSYAYRIPVSAKGTLSLGLNTRLEHAWIDWTMASALDVTDINLSSEGKNALRPNFGVGAYYSGEKFFLGLSIPRFMKNTNYLLNSQTDISGLQVSTFYLMGGIMTRVSSQVQFHPTIMLSMNPSAPIDLDLNANFIFMNRLWLGASYRMGDSFDLLAHYQLTDQLRAGVGYDLTTSALRKATSGSYELMVEYTFTCPDCKIKSVRYF